MKEPRLRDKLLQILADSYPANLRFTELYEAADSPSRSVFSEALRWLEQQKLVTREEISYKNVIYKINLEEFQKKIKTDKARLEEIERKLERNKNDRR